jgi:hypothetical protein
MRRATLLWTLLAVCGVLLVAGVTMAASTLSTQTIGLSREPLSAGDELSPSGTPTATPQARRAKTTRPRPTPTATAVPTVDDDHSGSGGDDSSGRGRGRGRGRGGDDD